MALTDQQITAQQDPNAKLAMVNPNAPTNGGGTSGAPSYVNLSDPVQAAVWQSFQQKGIQPRDQGDFQYWVNNINQSGGLENGYANAGGSGTWAQRMAQGSGGVGDYGSGGTAGGAGGSQTGPGGFSYSPSDFANGPLAQFALKNGESAIQSSALARGTGLSSGLAKQLEQYSTGLTGQLVGQDYGMQANTFGMNSNNLFNLANLGLTGTNEAANYLTSGAAAQAAGTVGSANNWMNTIGNIGNTLTNASLYQAYNPYASSYGGGQK